MNTDGAPTVPLAEMDDRGSNIVVYFDDAYISHEGHHGPLAVFAARGFTPGEFAADCQAGHPEHTPDEPLRQARLVSALDSIPAVIEKLSRLYLDAH